jgi:hypothetical protein
MDTYTYRFGGSHAVHVRPSRNETDVVVSNCAGMSVYVYVNMCKVHVGCEHLRRHVSMYSRLCVCVYVCMFACVYITLYSIHIRHTLNSYMHAYTHKQVADAGYREAATAI